MNGVIRLAATILIAMGGGMLGKKYKLPAGSLTGAIIAVVICNLVSNKMYFPTGLRTYVQIASGALVGSRIKRKDLEGMGQFISSGIVLMIAMITMNVVFGILLYHFTDLDAATAFYGTAPGGMQDMGLISQDFGADPVIVSVIQLVRMVFILTCFPLLYRIASKYVKRTPQEEKNENSAQLNSHGDIALEEKEEVIRLGGTIILATIGGVLFRTIGMPGGALTGAMLFVAGFGIMTEKSFFPVSFKAIIQMFAGAYIGAQVNTSSFIMMKSLFIPLVFLCLGLIIFTSILAFILSKLSKLDFVSCMLMSTPGGLSEMTLLADEFDCNVPKVVFMHTLRVMVVISVFPLILDKVIKLVT